MARTEITDDDEGKTVVDADGERIGVVTGVRGGTVYVDPAPGVGEQLLAKFGLEDVDEEDYPLEATRIDDVTDDRIHLRGNT